LRHPEQGLLDRLEVVYGEQYDSGRPWRVIVTRGWLRTAVVMLSSLAPNPAPFSTKHGVTR